MQSSCSTDIIDSDIPYEALVSHVGEAANMKTPGMKAEAPEAEP